MSLKELWKMILTTLIIVLLGIAILFLRCFVIDKDDGKKAQKDTSSSSSTSTESTSSESGDSKLGNFVSDFKEGYNESKKDEKDYNEYNFDDRLLMYEGEQAAGSVKAALEVIMQDATDDFYDNPNVILVNSANSEPTEVTYQDADSYKSALMNISNSIDDNAKYTISFNYGALHAVAKDVVITKK